MSLPEPVIVVVGSTMIDMIAYSQKIPQAGETVIGDSFSLGFGGKGANQAVMASRMGSKVFMVNTLGDDVFGDTTVKNFQEQGIDTTYLSRVAGASGVAPIWVEPNGTNRIICVPGANNSMTTTQAESALKSIGKVDVVIGQLEIPQEVTIAAFRQAHELGAQTILNPAPFAPLSTVKAIDTTGAGDAFVGAFASGIAAGMDIERSIKLGCACASDSVTRRGTQSSYPTRAQVEVILARTL